MKQMTIYCTWRSSHWVDVPDDWDVPSHLSDFPQDVLEELTSQNAELVDWGSDY